MNEVVSRVGVCGELVQNIMFHTKKASEEVSVFQGLHLLILGAFKVLLKLLGSPLGFILLLLEVSIVFKGSNVGDRELLFHDLGDGVSIGGLHEE